MDLLDVKMFLVDFVMDGQDDVLLEESCCEWCAAAPANWAVFVGGRDEVQ